MLNGTRAFAAAFTISLLGLAAYGIDGQTSSLVTEFEAIVQANQTVLKNFPATVVSRGEDGYRKEAIRLEKVSYDIRKTDSLVSPYIGIFDYVVTWRLGRDFSSAKEAEASEADKNSVQTHLQAEYSYSKNRWVKTTHKSVSNVSGQWNVTALEEIKSDYFRGPYPYLSIFPKVFLSLR
jgi:hypothetical protein